MLKKSVENMVSECGTANPFVIADNNGLIYEYRSDLPAILLGITITIHGNRPMVLLNSSIKENSKRYLVMAHELKHAISHHDLPIYYSQAYRGGEKCEHEAELWATYLMVHLYEEIYGQPCELFNDLKRVFDVKESMRIYFE